MVNKMDDLISRRLVMKTLCERRCGDKPKGCPAGFCPESLAVDCIPSVERKRGKWIAYEDEDGEHYGDKCSECGEWYVMPYGKTNFCPNCGADMREETEDVGKSDTDDNR